MTFLRVDLYTGLVVGIWNCTWC